MFYLNWEHKDYFGQSPLGWLLPIDPWGQSSSPCMVEPPKHCRELWFCVQPLLPLLLKGHGSLDSLLFLAVSSF